jgi:hypothetical protein
MRTMVVLAPLYAISMCGLLWTVLQQHEALKIAERDKALLHAQVERIEADRQTVLQYLQQCEGRK